MVYYIIKVIYDHLELQYWRTITLVLRNISLYNGIAVLHTFPDFSLYLFLGLIKLKIVVIIFLPLKCYSWYGLECTRNRTLSLFVLLKMFLCSDCLRSLLLSFWKLTRVKGSWGNRLLILQLLLFSCLTQKRLLSTVGVRIGEPLTIAVMEKVIINPLYA